MFIISTKAFEAIHNHNMNQNINNEMKLILEMYYNVLFTEFCLYLIAYVRSYHKRHQLHQKNQVASLDSFDA